jgi:hypothetical protein
MGAGSLAAKTAADRIVGNSAGLYHLDGLGDASMSLPQGGFEAPLPQGNDVPYESRIIQAGRHLKLFGIPDWLEFEMRDSARYVASLDPDLACKRSWSMSVKIAEQRQRNYQRRVERMHQQAWQSKGRSVLKRLLGFEWPY